MDCNGPTASTALLCPLLRLSAGPRAAGADGGEASAGRWTGLGTCGCGARKRCVLVDGDVDAAMLEAEAGKGAPAWAWAACFMPSEDGGEILSRKYIHVHSGPVGRHALARPVPASPARRQCCVWASRPAHGDGTSTGPVNGQARQEPGSAFTERGRGGVRGYFPSFHAPSRIRRTRLAERQFTKP